MLPSSDFSVANCILCVMLITLSGDSGTLPLSAWDVMPCTCSMALLCDSTVSGQSTTAASRHCHDMASDVKSDVKPRHVVGRFAKTSLFSMFNFII